MSCEAKKAIAYILETTGEELGVNEYLIREYMAESGANHFKTFKQWKDEGYGVNKGESAFRVWSAPFKAKKKIEAPAYREAETLEQKYRFFGMCCLFNELQVSKIDDSCEKGSVLAPLRALPPMLLPSLKLLQKIPIRLVSVLRQPINCVN